ncbi:unnamed protein product [Ambrosiozyma monospora]|uniref:Unnamed protein product n=1 Tax=Ambrosiozyma monospora TaxID=43982 RepID=A0ACB5TTD5_AMBMO|nr:unnamed protein product [Ambrosiozyma monospora]
MGVDPDGAEIEHTLLSNLQMEELQSSDGHWSTVLKISWEDFESIFKPLAKQTKQSPHVVLKVYSSKAVMFWYYNLECEPFSFRYPELSVEENFHKASMWEYQNEVSAYQRIEEYNDSHQDNKINAPKLFQHGYCCIELRSGALIEGMFLAMEYLPFVNNKDSIDKTGIVEKLKSIGISHDDLHTRNMCVDENGETYIYDFGSVVIDSHLTNSETTI